MKVADIAMHVLEAIENGEAASAAALASRRAAMGADQSID